MIKNAMIILYFFIVQFGCAQHKNDWKKISLDAKRKYSIERENEVVNRDFFNEPPDTNRAALQMENVDYCDIKFTSAEMKHDTLKILIYQTDEAYHHEYLISIVNGVYDIKYKFLVSGEVDDEGEIVPYETVLNLNTADFKYGTEVRGYTQFRGKCLVPCNEDWITVKGNFKAIIR